MKKSLEGIATGFYAKPSAHPGGMSRATKVHIINEFGPCCGYNPAPGYEFQNCANGHKANIVECKGCKQLLIGRVA